MIIARGDWLLGRSVSDEGALGLADILSWNRVSMVHHIWNLFKDTDNSLWTQWVWSNFIKGRSFGVLKSLMSVLGIGGFLA